MILTCQNCSTSFRLDETMLKSSGSKVRCSRCKHVWWVRQLVSSEVESKTQTVDAKQTDIGTAAAAGVAAMMAVDERATDNNAGADAGIETPPSPPELKMGIEDLAVEDLAIEDEGDDIGADEVNLDELDLLLGDEPPPSDHEGFNDSQTEELDFADIEKMLEVDDTASSSPRPSSETDERNDGSQNSDDRDVEAFDLDLDDLESLLSDDTDLGNELDLAFESDRATESTANEEATSLAPALEDALEDEPLDLDLEEAEEVNLSEVDQSSVDLADETASTTVFDDDEINLELAPELESLFAENDEHNLSPDKTEELDLDALSDENEKTDRVSPETGSLELEMAIDDEDLDSPLSGEEQTEAASSDMDVDDLDLDDLENFLDADEDIAASELPIGEEQLELASESGSANALSPDGDDLNLVLEDLDLETTSAATTSESEEGEIELDLDLDSVADDGEEDPDDATRELNLDDIEKILDAQGPAISKEAIAEDKTPEPHQDSESKAISSEADLIAVADEGLLGEDDTTEGSDALDLSELEKMLEVEDETDSPGVSDDGVPDELDLDFDLQPSNGDEDNLELEFDLLDDDEERPSTLFDTSESEDLELNLDIDTTPVPENGDAEDDLELEFMGKDADNEPDRENQTEAEGDRTGIEDDDPVSAAEPVEAVAMGAAGAVASRDLTQELMDEMAAADTQSMDAQPAEGQSGKSESAPEKKKSRKLLLFILLLAILGAVGYYFYTTMGSDEPKFKLSDLPQIPFISGWLGGNKTPEAVVPVETTLKGSWVQSSNDSRLYVIHGRVRNEYSQPRSYIRVTGRIYADGRKFSRAAHAYCGNMPSRQDLERMPVAELQKILANRNGANDTNVMVATGKEVPFTVVFAGLPDDVELEEYEVEISGSLPANQEKAQ